MSKKKNGNSSQKVNPAAGKEKQKLLWLAGISLVVGSGAMLFALYGPGPYEPPVLNPQEVAQGAAIFKDKCAVCHGQDGVGQDISTPQGGLTDAGGYIAPAMNQTGHTWHHPEAMLFQIVKNGSMADDSPMRGWAGKLTDQEIWAVIHYMESLWPQQLYDHYQMNVNKSE